MKNLGVVQIIIQPELIFSLFIMMGLSMGFIYVGKKISAADPTQKPKGIILVCETGVRMLTTYMNSIMPSNFESNYYPYFIMMFVYILVSNISGLFAFQSPTSNFSITLSITLITFTLIQFNAIRKKGGVRYIKDIIWPPTNILGTISPLISLSMRIFGNVLSGSILMSLVYELTAWLSNLLVPVPIDFLGPFLGGILHFYFDVFTGFIQALVFITLSSILIALEAE